MLTVATLGSREARERKDVLTVQQGISRLWEEHRTLTAVGLGMAAIFGVFLAGLVIDPRVVTGQPVWLKPAKFAISTAIYSLTLAWCFTYIPSRTRMKRIVGNVTAGVFVLEVALIALQAARGTTSHFNLATPFDMTVFAVMGTAILVQTLVVIGTVIALFRQKFSDRALGAAFRFGLLIAVLGAAVGGMMTRPTAAQLAAAQTARMTISGAHTVGAPDGGPGLPGTGWSMEYGDLRVPHFVGLHAFQLLPLFALLLGQRRSVVSRERTVLVAAASYTALFAILLIQALGGQSVLAPGGAVLTSLIVWFVATAVALTAALRPGRAIAGVGSTKMMVS